METGPDPSLFDGRDPAIHPEICEFLLLILAIAVLAWLSLDLAAAGDLGRGSRYAGTHPDSVRMRWLLSHVGTQIAILGLSGWMVLVLGRRTDVFYFRHAFFGFFVPAGALWFGIWKFTRRLPDNPLPYSWTILLLVVLLVIGRILHHQIRNNLPKRSPIHPAVYPLFVFLSGFGWLWILDFSARAMTTPVLWMGAHRWDHMIQAFAVLTLMAGIAPALMSAFLRILPWGDTGKPVALRRILLPSLVRMIALLIPVVAIGLFWWTKSSLITTKTSEILRFAGCLILAWVTFRWGHWQDKSSWIVWMMAGFLFLLTGFAGTRDLGQVLVACVAVSALISGLMVAVIRRIGVNSHVAVGLGAVAGIGLVIGGFLLLIRMGPAFSNPDFTLFDKKVDLSHVAKRVHAVQTSFSGEYQYLSELRWFMHDAPLWGYGLGKTPYCGTLSDVVATCRGLPKETPSDYVFGALSGVFGPVGAWIMAALTADWLLLLCNRHSLPPDHPEYNTHQYTHWLALAFSASAISQLLVTCLGSVGVVPLTGISFPLISHGGTSLCFMALAAGLVLNSPTLSQPREALS